MIKNPFISGVLAVIMLMLTACVKNDAAVPIPTTVSMNVINATEDVLNFYLNGTRQNSVIGLFPLAANGYVAIPYGSQLTFKKQFNKEQFENTEVLFTVPVNVDSVGAGIRYSLFAAGQGSSSNFFVKDTLVNDAKNAKLRFIVASPNVNKLRVILNDTLRFTTSAFKYTSVFTPVGNGIKNLEIRDAANNALLYSTKFTIVAGNNYTLFTQGNTVNNTFKAGLINNQ